MGEEKINRLSARMASLESVSSSDTILKEFQSREGKKAELKSEADKLMIGLSNLEKSCDLSKALSVRVSDVEQSRDSNRQVARDIECKVDELSRKACRIETHAQIGWEAASGSE